MRSAHRAPELTSAFAQEPIPRSPSDRSERVAEDSGWVPPSERGRTRAASGPVLLRALESPHWPVRARAAFELSRRGNARATSRLAKHLVDDPSEVVRGFCALALRWIGSRRALPAVRQAVRDPSDRVRREAILALDRLGGASVAGAVRPLLRDPSMSVRIAAAVVLGTRRDRAGVPALLARLRSSELWERPAILVALGRIRAPSSIPALERAASDRMHSVRVCAIHALTEFGGPRPRAVARRKLTDRSWAVRGAAALALGRRGDRTDAPRLVRLLRDPHPWPRRCALYALGERGVVGSLPEVRAALDSLDLEIQLAAIWAVGRLGDASSLPRLCGLLRGRRPIATPARPLIATGDGGVRLVSDAESRLFDALVEAVARLATASGDPQAWATLREVERSLDPSELRRPARLPSPVGAGPPTPPLRQLFRRPSSGGGVPASRQGARSSAGLGARVRTARAPLDRSVR